MQQFYQSEIYTPKPAAATDEQDELKKLEQMMA